MSRSRSLFFASQIVLLSLLAGICCAFSQEPPQVVADSVRDFSGSQGANGWSYGYWDRSSDPDGTYVQVEDFQRLDHFGTDVRNGLSRRSEFTTGELWYLEDGRYYTSLWAEGGHPHGTMDLGTYAKAEHWVVRRWVSNVDARVEIRGHAGKVMPWGENWRGDVKVSVVVGGTTVYSERIDDGGHDYSVSTTVQKGAPIDFLIGPGSAIGVIELTATIEVQRGAR